MTWAETTLIATVLALGISPAWGETCAAPNIARAVWQEGRSDGPLWCPPEGLCYRVGLQPHQFVFVRIVCLTATEHAAALARQP